MLRKTIRQFAGSVSLAFCALACAAPKEVPPSLAFQQAVTHRLAASSPLLDPRILEAAPGDDNDADRLLDDPNMIAQARGNFKGVEEDYQRLFKLQGKYVLSRFGGFLTLTLAMNGKGNTPESEAQIARIRAKFGHMLDDPSYRSTCYSFAMGDLTSNEFLFVAMPGQRTSGLETTSVFRHSDVLKGAIDDGAEYVGNDPAKLVIPEGKRLILYYFNETEGHRDMHWVRLDRAENGKMLASSKFGTQRYIRRHEVTNIYSEMANTYAPQGEPGYKFRAFFLIPAEGIDVGLDAYYKLRGEISGPPVNEPTPPALARQHDIFMYQKMMNKPGIE